MATTRRNSYIIDFRLTRLRCLARHCCTAVQGSKLIKPSSPGLWLLRVVFCARLGRQLYILPRLGVNQWQQAWDSPGSSFVRRPSVSQSSLLWVVPGAQHHRPSQAYTDGPVCVSGGARCSLHVCACPAAGTLAPHPRAPLTTPRREAWCKGLPRLELRASPVSLAPCFLMT